MRLLNFDFNADPDPTYYSNADPDPASPKMMLISNLVMPIMLVNRLGMKCSPTAKGT
jgi:hypothetical protein